MNSLQQFFRIQIGQAPIEEKQLTIAAFQFSQGIRSAQGFGRCDARLQEVLHDLFASPGIRTGHNYCRIKVVGEGSRGCHEDVVIRKP